MEAYLKSIAMAAAFMRGDGEDTMRDDAAFLLDFYDTFKDFVASDVTDIALSSLAKIEGRFGRPPYLILCSSDADCLETLEA